MISLFTALPLVSGCGGGGGGGGLTIRITAINPDSSADLNGGVTVTVFGTNFNAFVAIQVFFGIEPATNLVRVSDTELTVRAPNAPGGVAGVVDIRIVGTDADLETAQHIFGQSFTYIGPPQNPNPQTITRTTYTPTGAEEFFINGTSLGTPNQTQLVEFEGVGRVTALVSGDATSLRGNAPIIGTLAGPLANIRVIVDPDNTAAELPTLVNYNAAPAAAVPGVVFLEGNGDASQPRRLAEGFGIVCTSGTDGTWGNANDEIWMVFGPQGGPVQQIAVRVAGNPVGNLSARNSIPAILDANTFCVYSVGPDQTPNTADDGVWLITQAQSGNPTATFHNHPNMNTAPLGAISANHVAFMFAGIDGILANADDRLIIMEFNGTALNRTITSTVSDAADNTAGAGNLSIPWSSDGDNVYVVTNGNDATPSNANDRIFRLRISDGAETLLASAPSLVARPIAVSGTVSVSVTRGLDNIAGNADDRMIAFSDTGNSITVNQHAINGLNTASPVPFVPFGTGGVAVPSLGPDFAPANGNEDIIVFTDPVAGVNQVLSGRRGPAVLTSLRLADNSFVVHNRGDDGAGATGDEVATFLNGTTLLQRNFSIVPLWDQATAAQADDSRVFAIGRGGDAQPATGDEVLIVQQTLSIGQLRDSVTIGIGLGQPLTNTLPFVPIGNGWGLALSPGSNGFFGDGNDVLVLVHY